MLTAEAVDLPGVRVWAKDADRATAYRCPGCDGAPLVLKRGRIVVAHFAHPAGVQDCSSEPETELHMATKLTLAEVLEGVVEHAIECPGRRRRADVFVHTAGGGGYVVEVQLAPLTVEQLEERTRDQNRAGYAVMWIFGDANHAHEHGSRRGLIRASAARRAASLRSEDGARWSWAVDDQGRLWLDQCYAIAGARTLERRVARYQWRPWETIGGDAVEQVLEDGLLLIGRRSSPQRLA